MMARPPMAEPEATAYHEAGHAVVAMALRVPVLYATVEPLGRGAVAGHVRYGQPQRSRQTQILFMLAGPIAEAMHRGARFRCCAANIRRLKKQLMPPGQWPKPFLEMFRSFMGQTDEVVAERLAREVVNCNTQTVRDCLDAATDRATYVLRQRWPAVERVAAALRRYGTVREAHLLRLLR